MKKSVNNLDVVMQELKEYIDSCKGDKYAGGDQDIDTGLDLLNTNHKVINTWNMMKYLKRYRTEGFKKSSLKSDLMKVIHYALFELEAIRETEDTKINLCNSCTQELPTCGAIHNDIRYGDGIGNDTIIRCQKFTPKQKGNK